MGTQLNPVYPQMFHKWISDVAMTWEAGLSNRDPKADPGGLTNKGITWATFLRLAPKVLGTVDKKRFYGLTWDDVAALAYQGYWIPGAIETVKSDPIKVILMDADFNGGGIHSLGYPSIDALNKANPKPETVIANRLNWYKSLKNWPQNQHGWTNRLVDMQKKLTGIQGIIDHNLPLSIFLVILGVIIVLKVSS